MNRLLLLATVTSLAILAPVSAENWPQWRGPKNDGHSSEKGLPAKWSETENIVWKAPMPGPGASTPCVWGDKIFLTSMEGSEVVALCYSAKDGKPLWKFPLGSSSKAYRNDEGNDASASPSCDGKHVFFFTGTGMLLCTDLDGKKVWEKDVQKDYGSFSIQFGVHQTPVLFKDRLYVTLLHRKAQLVLALEAATGKEIWKHERKSDGIGESPDVYSSAFMWTKGDKAMLIVHGNDYCTAHKLENGEEVWRVTELNPKAKYNRAWRAVSSPVVSPDLIVVPSCKRGVTVAINPETAHGSIAPGSTGEIWRLPANTPDVPSPLVVGDLVTIMGETGVLYCYEAATGKKVYEEKVTNMRHRANPVLADGKIYLLGRDKTCVVVKPGKEFDVISKNELPDNFTASPAISEGRIYLRGFKTLWAIGTK